MGVGAMLLKFSTEISECYRLAADARGKAAVAPDPDIRQDLIDIEQRWLRLARRHTLMAGA
jgi:hypothetical protein